jgi:molybdopterin-binding protein
MTTEMLRLQEAAELLGISYPTIKQWIYRRKVRSVKTAGGHHRIPRTEVDRLLGDAASKKIAQKKPIGINAISGRNKLSGVVRNVRFEGLLAEVTIDIGGQLVTAIITRTACNELGLRRGVRAYALMKSTEVMVIRG